MAKKHKRDVNIYIDPAAKGYFTERDLIGAYGAASIYGNYSQFDTVRPHAFFRVKAQEYSLEAGLDKKAVYVERNHVKLEFPLKPRYVKQTLRVHGSLQDIYEPIEAQITVGWTPKRLNIKCWETVYYRHLSSPQDLKNRVLRYLPVSSTDPQAEKDMRMQEVSKDTKATFPPNRLVERVRDNLVQATSYDSPSDFYQDVTAMFQSVLDTVKTGNSYSAFWNENKDQKTPKQEPKITEIVRSYLVTPARIKRLEVVYQHLEAGILDFHIKGFLTNGKRVSVSIECKHAHSSDLLHGLQVQLPTYMQQRECEFGIYCVLWFKGIDFPEPKKFISPDGLALYLSSVARDEGLENIRILPFDLTYPTQPSKVVKKDPEERPSWATPENVFFVDYFGKMPPEYLYIKRFENL
jgi:hypothetical protein